MALNDEEVMPGEVLEKLLVPATHRQCIRRDIVLNCRLLLKSRSHLLLLLLLLLLGLGLGLGLVLVLVLQLQLHVVPHAVFEHE